MSVRVDQLNAIVSKALKRRKLSAAEASRLATGSASTIKNMRAGHSPLFETVERLFGVLGVNLSYSLDDDLPVSSVKVPMLGYVAAGGGDDHDDTTRAFISDEDNFDEVSAPPMITRAGSVFCLEVRGGSMRPAYSDGDRLYFHKDDPLRNQRERLIGHNCAIRLQSNETYVKRLARADSGRANEWNLESLNPAWPVMTNQKIVEALPVRYVSCKV